MVGSCDFSRVKSNEAYMLVYTLRSTSGLNPPSNKHAVGVENGQKHIKPNGLETSKNVNPATKNYNLKQAPQENQAVKRDQFKGRSEDPILNTKHNVSLASDFPTLSRVTSFNGVEHSQNGMKPNDTLLAQALVLKRTVSHPLFGSALAEKAPVPEGPAWLVNPGDSQLQKRKPEDSSRTSSCKKLIKPQRSGLQRMRDMKRRLKTIEAFNSLPLSRVTSMDVCVC